MVHLVSSGPNQLFPQIFFVHLIAHMLNESPMFMISKRVAQSSVHDARVCKSPCTVNDCLLHDRLDFRITYAHIAFETALQNFVLKYKLQYPLTARQIPYVVLYSYKHTDELWKFYFTVTLLNY
jgi:hypothetical protein